MIARSLGTQIHSLRLRSNFADDPVDQLMAAIALLGVALCDHELDREIAPRLERVNALLDEQVDEDGLHRSRSAKVQFMLMVELTTRCGRPCSGNPTPTTTNSPTCSTRCMSALDARLARHRRAPPISTAPGRWRTTSSSSLQAQSPSRARSTGTAGGYGRLISGKSIVVADSGLPVPSAGHARRHMHAGALCFEFSHGRDLRGLQLRAGVPADDGAERAAVPAGHRAFGADHQCALGGLHPDARAAEHRVVPDRPRPRDGRPRKASSRWPCARYGYAERFGVVLERRLTLIAEGTSLVGQDRLLQGPWPDERGLRHPLPSRAPGAGGRSRTTWSSSSSTPARLELPLGRRRHADRGQRPWHSAYFWLPSDAADRARRAGRCDAARSAGYSRAGRRLRRRGDTSQAGAFLQYVRPFTRLARRDGSPSGSANPEPPLAWAFLRTHGSPMSAPSPAAIVPINAR